MIRQASLMRDRGWDVTVAGLDGARPVPDWWSFISIGNTVSPPSVETPVARLLRRSTALANRVGAFTERAAKRLSAHHEKIARAAFWVNRNNRRIFNLLRECQADLIIAHDWYAAPIASRLARRLGCAYSVDVHEYAREQFFFAAGSEQRQRWDRIDRPYIDHLQSQTFRNAAAVTTVCDGIADLLEKDYSLHDRPSVVRSMPFYEERTFRPTGAVIEVLYHGLIVPTRGVDDAIRSVGQWRPEFVLVVRGSGTSEYLAYLKRLADELGVADRVRFEDSVPFADIIGAANRSDVGYMVLDSYSPQRTFTLPNKFFEYIMAGLAICVSDLPEMARIVKHHNLGLLVKNPEPLEIASAINSLTRSDIDAMKRRSLEAARELCWEKESIKMFAAYERGLRAA